MAEINPVESITYKRVAYMCSLDTCDVHIFASTLWGQTPAPVIIAGMLVGAKRYNCCVSPCIVDDTSTDNKIWYCGIVDDKHIPIVWIVEHSCKVYRQAKRVTYYDWPVVAHWLYLYDARAIQAQLERWKPNSMASACMRARALDWLNEQPILSDTELGWAAGIDLRKEPLFTRPEG